MTADKPSAEKVPMDEQSSLVKKSQEELPPKYEENFKGPIQNRGCTDIICCLLFVLCFIAMLAVGIYESSQYKYSPKGFAKGDPNRLLYPTDSFGNRCGQGKFINKPKLFFFDLVTCAKMGPKIVNGCPTPQVCVEACPNKTWIWAEEFVKGDDADKKSMFCKYNIFPENSSLSIKELVENGDCAPYTLNSDTMVGRCIPNDLVNMAKKVVDMNNKTIDSVDVRDGEKFLAMFLNAQEYGVKIIQDLRSSWHMCIIGLIVAMLISLLYVLLLRWIAGFMTWFTIVAFLGLFGYGSYYTTNKYITMKNQGNHTGSLNTFTTDLSYYTNLEKTWLAFSIICICILVIIVIMLIFLRKRIIVAIGILKFTSRAVGGMMFTLFWPIFPFLMQIVLFVFWGSSTLFLASSGTAEFTKMNLTDNSSLINSIDTVQDGVNNAIHQIPCDPNANGTHGSICNFIKYGGDEYTIYLQFFQLFMLFWTMNFIIALGEITLAGAFASYYWAKDKSSVGYFPVLSSLGRAFKYHLGSIAFGALLIALVQLVRVILEYIDFKLKQYTDSQVVKFIMCCLKCMTWCLEKILRFINKNAYIMIAVYGKNFCTSAKRAFFLILRNVVRVVVIDKVTDFLLFIGKLVVVGIVGLLAFLFFSGDVNSFIPLGRASSVVDKYNPELNYYLVPVIIIIIGTYVIASGFFNVYSMGVDTIFLCFLEDMERNEDKEHKSYSIDHEQYQQILK